MKKCFVLSRPEVWPLKYFIKEAAGKSPRRFIFIIPVFLVMFINQYCLAANPVERKIRTSQAQDTQDYELSGKIENGIRVIEVKAFRYKFEPDPIVAKLGERVRLIVTSADVAHGLAISEFKVNVSIPPGKTETVEFIADKKGTFHAYCSVYCGPGHQDMHGDFVVK